MVEATQLTPLHKQWFSAGVQHLLAGRWAEAEAIYRDILAERPDAAHAHHNLALALKSQGKSQEAVAEFHRALALEPAYPGAYSNLGDTLRELNQPQQALEAFRSALALKPDFPEAWNNMGILLRKLNRSPEAIEAFRKAVAQRPAFLDAYNNLGNALCDGYFPADAVEPFRKALTMRADSIQAWLGLAGALSQCGQQPECLACYDEVLKIQPNHADAAGGRLCTVHYHPGYDATAIYQEARRWNERFARPLAGEITALRNDATSQRRLRIGYVSPDFRGHCQSLFTTPLLAHHDHEAFEIFCYANVQCPDAVTARLKGHADVWRDIFPLTDQAAAQLIKQDKIDILVDLALHTAGNRLGTFARKPAPIQVTWLGYPGTTGMDAIDYRVTDEQLDPDHRRSDGEWHGQRSGTPRSRPCLRSSKEGGPNQNTADCAIRIAPLAVPLAEGRAGLQNSAPVLF